MEDEDEFVRAGAGVAGAAAAELQGDRRAQPRRRDAPTAPTPRPLTPRQVELKRADGALLVDVRTDLQFDDAHVGGAIAITALRAGFGSKLAWLADREQEVVLVGRDDADALHAADLAAAVGITRFGGYLAGGMTSWREDRRPVERIERVPLDELHERWEADRDGVQVLDVRERDEWDAGHIPGSVLHAVPRPRATFPASSTATARSRSSARQASARRSARACSSATARGGAGTSSTAACRAGSASGWPVTRYGSTLSSPICVPEPWNSISKMPVIVRLEGDRLGLVRLDLLRDVVAVDVDLLGRVVADAEADGVALVEGRSSSPCRP